MEQPITREEQYLSAIADSSGTLPDAPVTREEMFLAAIAGADVIPPDPVTRKEAYLKAILDSGGGGGGGSTDWTSLEVYMGSYASSTNYSLTGDAAVDLSTSRTVIAKDYIVG